MRCFTFLLFAAMLYSCSSKILLFNGKKLPEVTIADIGDLYASYTLTAQEEQQLAAQIRDAALMQEIKVFSQETNWPEAINTLNKRLAVRRMLTSYTYYKLAVVGTRTLVVVPADKNRDLPAAFIPQTNMYMFFNSRSVLQKF